jgi:hypothetical protein
MGNESPELFRHRVFYQISSHLERAGLEHPRVNTDTLWSSLDGPLTIKDLDCDAFDTGDCLAPGFSLASADARSRSPVFSSAAIFDRVARESPRCGDCLLKLVLNRTPSSLEPLLPHPVKKVQQRETVVKALMRYQYVIVQPDASFYMVTDAEQAEHTLLRPYIKDHKKTGQMCLIDEIAKHEEREIKALRKVINMLLEGLLPEKSSYEK